MPIPVQICLQHYDLNNKKYTKLSKLNIEHTVVNIKFTKTVCVYHGAAVVCAYHGAAVEMSNEHIT